MYDTFPVTRYDNVDRDQFVRFRPMPMYSLIKERVDGPFHLVLFRIQGMAPLVSTSSSAGATAPPGDEAAPTPFPGIDAMAVDHLRTGGSGADGSRGMGTPGVTSVSAAVATVVAMAPTHTSAHDMAPVPMHKVLSAPMLSPPATSEGARSREGGGSGGLDPTRLPPLRQVRAYV